MTPSEIRDFRNQLDLSQREFAKGLGVSQPAVQSWETGRASPSEATQELMRRWRENVNESGTQDWQKFLIASAGTALGVKVIFDYINSRG